MRLILFFNLIFWSSMGQAVSLSHPIDWPQGLQATPLAQHLVINGVPTRADVFVSKAPLQELTKVFASRMGSGYMDVQIPQGRVLSKHYGKVFLTVQLTSTAEGMTKGIVASSLLDGAAKKNNRPDWISSEAKVVSDIESLDQEISARHITYILSGSLLNVSNDLINRLAAYGWINENSSVNKEHQQQLLVLLKNKYGGQGMIVMSEQESQVRVVINLQRKTKTWN